MWLKRAIKSLLISGPGLYHAARVARGLKRKSKRNFDYIAQRENMGHKRIKCAIESYRVQQSIQESEKCRSTIQCLQCPQINSDIQRSCIIIKEYRIPRKPFPSNERKVDDSYCVASFNSKILTSSLPQASGVKRTWLLSSWLGTREGNTDL